MSAEAQPAAASPPDAGLVVFSSFSVVVVSCFLAPLLVCFLIRKWHRRRILQGGGPAVVPTVDAEEAAAAMPHPISRPDSMRLGKVATAEQPSLSAPDCSEAAAA